MRRGLSIPTPERILYIGQAFRLGMSVEDIHAASKVDPWFLQRIESIIATEAAVKDGGLPVTAQGWLTLKQKGFCRYAQLGLLVGVGEDKIRAARHAHKVHPVYKRVDTCAAEIPSETPYMYSCYEAPFIGGTAKSEIDPSEKEKVIILGGGT